MPVGKKTRIIHAGRQTENPEDDASGFSIPIFAMGRINP